MVETNKTNLLLGYMGESIFHEYLYETNADNVRIIIWTDPVDHPDPIYDVLEEIKALMPPGHLIIRNSRVDTFSPDDFQFEKGLQYLMVFDKCFSGRKSTREPEQNIVQFINTFAPPGNVTLCVLERSYSNLPYSISRKQFDYVCVEGELLRSKITSLYNVSNAGTLSAALDVCSNDTYIKLEKSGKWALAKRSKHKFETLFHHN